MKLTISLTLMMLLPCKAAVAATPCDSLSMVAVPGNPLAQTEFAYCLLRGIGRPTDVEQAIEMLESAAASGLPKAKANLASIYLFETRDDAQYARALSLLDSALEAGYQGAHLPLAALHHSGIGVPINDELALLHLVDARRAGDVLAAFVIFAIERLGLYGTGQDLKAADDSFTTFDSLIEANPLLDRMEYLAMLSTDPLTSRYLLEPEALVQAVGLARETVSSRATVVQRRSEAVHSRALARPERPKEVP